MLVFKILGPSNGVQTGQRETQVMAALDRGERAGETLIKAVDALEARLGAVLREPSPVSTGEEKKAGAPVQLAITINRNAGVVEECIIRLIVIMERMEL